ncbi:Similar to S.cerevisiae protein MKK2 (MAPKK involved in the protein kinase C signaling pathway) [Malassezia sympodialis ATCC 42132]|uniref:Similar to S.cerevisiae protein MKK2 (MAPKK involved in the protein kinase C signaling pathway) n=1 Tax=Malassezia sympodialis (strain ATCC 42132) TaxID=1230383 RepID=A0A1M8A7P6_MALS4|nr:Similar to S.cerevisiae protein MKK2 (MAPKK involved in the protein kinase C signaling pathway) [Malassezia sympodialis ATCC 42132]
MASLIPPKRRSRPGVPKLSLAISNSPDNGESGPPSAGEATIMPPSCPNVQTTDMDTYMDEIRRVLDQMNVNESENILDKFENEQKGNLGSSTERFSSNSYDNLSSIAMQRGASQDSDISSTSSHISMKDLRDNLEVICSLGEGASGEVAKACIKTTGQIIARKTITTSPDPTIHRQLLRELNINKNCHSPYIVQYFGAFFEPESASITICMEYCKAGSMDSIYRRVKGRGGRVGEKVLAKLAESILKGLEYLHQQRIIHRDVKPSNILVTQEGQMKLCDFGVSGELINSVAGTFTGTCTYMAPERIMGQPYTITSDVWSLGVTILELALNRYPFTSDGEPPMGPIELLTYLLNSPLPTLADDQAQGIKWSRSLRDLVDRCLVRDGALRVGPRYLLHHPLILRAEQISNADMARFVAQVWNWPYP